MKLPDFYTMNGDLLQLEWNRLKPDEEVEAEVPIAPKGADRVFESDFDELGSVLGRPLDPSFKAGSFGEGFSAQNVRLKWRSGHPDDVPSVALLYPDRPWTTELFDFLSIKGGSERAYEAAKRILTEHGYPLGQRPDKIVWTWAGGDIFWAVASERGFYMAEESNSDPEVGDETYLKRVHIQSSWLEVAASPTFRDYLPPTSAFHWARILLPFLELGKQVKSQPSDGQELSPAKQWEALAMFGYLTGFQVANFHALRHERDLIAGQRNKASRDVANQSRKEQAQSWRTILQPHIERILDANPTVGPTDIYHILQDRDEKKGLANGRALFKPHEKRPNDTKPSEDSVTRFVSELKKKRP